MQTRRQFIIRGGQLVAAVTAAAASAGPTVFVRGAGAADKQLKVLQWTVRSTYNKWFDPWAKDWGRQARGRGDGGPRGLRRRRAAGHRGGGGPVGP